MKEAVRISSKCMIGILISHQPESCYFRKMKLKISKLDPFCLPLFFFCLPQQTLYVCVCVLLLMSSDAKAKLT